MSKLERIVQFTPAFDHRKENPNRGRGTVELFMTVKGDRGAVTFHMFTGWHLKETADADSERITYSPTDIKVLFRPGPSELATHSPIPRAGSSETDGACPYVDGGKCYQDIGYSIADPIFDALIREGSDAVWPLLEARYKEEFVDA